LIGTGFFKKEKITMTPWKNTGNLYSSEHQALCLWNDERLGSKASMQKLARFFASLDKMPRRDIPFWMVDRLSEWEGAIWDGDNLTIIFGPETVDQSFNDDGSFRWISDFLKFATNEPRQRAQNRIIERLRLMTASVAVYEVHLGHAFHFGYRVPVSYKEFYNEKFFNEETLKKAQFFRTIAPKLSISLWDARRIIKRTGARTKGFAAKPEQMTSLVEFIMNTDWDGMAD
jgi:hypothetical protein